MLLSSCFLVARRRAERFVVRFGLPKHQHRERQIICSKLLFYLLTNYHRLCQKAGTVATVYHGFIDVALVFVPSFVISIVGIVFEELIIEHHPPGMAERGGDCCDRAQELLDKVPPCTSKAFMFFLSSYRGLLLSAAVAFGPWQQAKKVKRCRGTLTNIDWLFFQCQQMVDTTELNPEW